MTFDEILSRFQVKRRYQGKAQCICPVHDDREASLTISRGNKGTMVFCHACGKDRTPEILEAVGLTMKDLFDDPDPVQTGEKWKAYVEGREKRKIEDVYQYVDLNGDYAFTRLRLSGKKFTYGILKDDRFSYGLQGLSRKEIPAVFCDSLKGVKKAIQEGQRIFYCEGEKDVKTVDFHGLTGITCGASGDWNPGCTTLFVGADVVILADNDEPGKASARTIEKDLLPVAKSVRVIVPTPELKKGDISDFFEDHTVEDLEKLLEAPEGANLDRFHMINDNGKITGVFDFEILQYLKETNDLFVLGGIPYIYGDGVFHPDPSGAKLKTMIRNLIYPEFIKSTTIKRVYDLFISDEGLQVTTEDLNCYPVEWVNFRNGFYDPVTKQFFPHSPEYRSTNQIPFTYDPERPIKGDMVLEWLYFICDSPDDIEMLCQFSGLCMTRDTRQQKFLILNGEGGSGKSTVIRMIEKMIGSENISNVSLDQLEKRFYAFGLMGKLLNSCADLEIDALSDVSTLKKVLGEDALLAEPKGKDAVSFKSYAKLIFSTNELPIVKAEKTNGFYRRLLILTMNKVPEKKETDFFDRLSAEIEDFIRISMLSLERLYENGQILESSGSKEAVKRLRMDSDTVEAFLNEKTERVQDSTLNRIKKSDLFREYENYCQDMDRQSLKKQNFFRAMKTKGFSEIRTGGIDYFKGIIYQQKFPKASLKIPFSDFVEVTDEEENEIPFK